MFSDCTSLTAAPNLPATILAPACYCGMFYGCTNIQIAPVLPATTLAESCYDNMFSDCSSLNYVQCHATNIQAYGCLFNWLSGVKTNGTFVKAASVDWPSGSSGIPVDWTIVDAE